MTDMKFKELQAYKTEGGWKAVFMGAHKDGGLFFIHYFPCGDVELNYHTKSGKKQDYTATTEEYNVTSEEWKEPRTWEVWTGIYEYKGSYKSITNFTPIKIGDICSEYNRNEDKWNDYVCIAAKKHTITEGEGL